MEFLEVRTKLQTALNRLIEEDHYLLRNNLSERSISHKLAEYLSPEFNDSDVDCEYNGLVNAHNGRKYIKVLRDMAVDLGLIAQDAKLDQELILRPIFPDIIVHERGENPDPNLLIVEIKKSTSYIPIEYDLEKLRRYTSDDLENVLEYDYGAFVLLETGVEHPSYTLRWFINGEEVNP